MCPCWIKSLFPLKKKILLTQSFWMYKIYNSWRHTHYICLFCLRNSLFLVLICCGLKSLTFTGGSRQIDDDVHFALGLQVDLQRGNREKKPIRGEHLSTKRDTKSSKITLLTDFVKALCKHLIQHHLHFYQLLSKFTIPVIDSLWISLYRDGPLTNFMLSASFCSL